MPASGTRSCRHSRVFEQTQKVVPEGWLYGLPPRWPGQELSGVSEVFRHKIEWCFSAIADALAICLEEARKAREISIECDVRQMANILVDCCEGAALRSRLRQNPELLNAMMNSHIRSVATS